MFFMFDRYTSARKLLKLDSIQFILENHTVCFLNTYRFTRMCVCLWLRWLTSTVPLNRVSVYYNMYALYKQHTHTYIHSSLSTFPSWTWVLSSSVTQSSTWLWADSCWWTWVRMRTSLNASSLLSQVGVATIITTVWMWLHKELKILYKTIIDSIRYFHHWQPLLL